MAPPFRADQIGSLLRPPQLLEARKHLSSSYDASTDASTKEAEESAIKGAVEKQLNLNIRPIVSGEYSRHIFYGGFFETLQGMTVKKDLPIPDAFRTDFPTTTGLASMGVHTRPAVIATSKMVWTSSAYLPEWNTLKSCVPQELWKECKVTLPAPSYQHIQLKPGTAWAPDSGYSDDKEYFTDLALAYVKEIEALYEAGCRNIQIDDPHMTYFCSSQFLDGCKKDGTDTDALLDLYLHSHNQILGEVKGLDELRLGMHLCRGNMSGSTHWVHGSYDKIAEKLFNQSKFETYYLEFDDTERQGGFEPLRHLPKGKNVVLGLVSTKKAEMEDEELLKEKVTEAAKEIARGQGISEAEALDCLAISPQCGFSSISTSGGKDFTLELMWQKLELVRDVAKELWG